MIATKGVAGQLDRVSLNFTIMNEDAWPKSRTVTAYAIDPDTARTVLASNVNYHYLQRFGAIMATSFMAGYASAITNAGTSTTGIFGTSTTHPNLSPSNKIAVGLGQVGTALSDVTKNYINIPPTVRVDSGVGLGILFMSDVS
jgi:intracellular multiplication protein IcmE